MAVFHYQVPKAASHYEIDTPVERIQHNGGSNRWAYAGGMAAMTTTAMVRNKPGYQGSLWIDPATGTILRVTLVADLKGNSTIERGAILVEYGPVTIAGKSLICPVRSLALSSAPATVDTNFEGVATEWLNENLFTNYHMFASTSRILNEQAAASALSPTQDTTSALNDQVSPVDGHRSPPESAPAVPVSQKAAIPSVDLPSSAPQRRWRRRRRLNRQPNNATRLAPEAPPAASPLPAAPSTATSTASQPPPPSNPPVSPTSEAKPSSVLLRSS